MNAAIRQLLRSHLIACAAVGCSVASALPPQLPEAAALTSAQLRAGYLECARRSEKAVLGPTEMIVCGAIADALLQRDFGGELELQLQWWRAARGEPAAPADAAVDAEADAESVPMSFEP